MAKHVVYCNFALEDLKPGYVVKLRNGEVRKVVEVGRRNATILLRADGAWDYTSHWNKDMTASLYLGGNPHDCKARAACKELDITEVYGYVNLTEDYWTANKIECDCRPLLWSRIPIVKMTVSEIEKKLGHKIEIVSEEE
ncbi:MAG: hypothetical protein IJ022_06220 [Burkholderiaceae bacterium]|nr:hypothetical protein [Burkholderiaceae bacterium]